MTDHSPLERRYRRWLALYPKSFRAEREDEMIAVLMQGAHPGQTRPRVREAANLATHGLRRRASAGRLPSNWERAHANVMFPLRIIALWLCFITVMLVGYHRGELWLLLLVPAILLHLYIAYRVRPRATPIAGPRRPHSTNACGPRFARRIGEPVNLAESRPTGDEPLARWPARRQAC